MSETNGELIAEARDYPPCGCNGCWNELQRLADALEAARERARLAEAHDVQPYPTAEAYERVCAALVAERARSGRLRTVARRSVMEVADHDECRTKDPAWRYRRSCLACAALDALQPGDLDD